MHYIKLWGILTIMYVIVGCSPKSNSNSNLKKETKMELSNKEKAVAVPKG